MPRIRATNNCCCQSCGKLFHVVPAIIKRGGGKYCSQPCARKCQPRTPLIDRFFAGVGHKDTNGCIHWAGSTNFRIASGGRRGKMLIASRLAYELCVGPIPKRLFVLHRCDNGSFCINPTHLFLGTQTENLTDMTAKGRRARGEQLGQTKLTEDQVRDIRQRRAGGEPYNSLARAFGVCRANIIQIVYRRTWTHVS